MIVGEHGSRRKLLADELLLFDADAAKIRANSSPPTLPQKTRLRVTVIT